MRLKSLLLSFFVMMTAVAFAKYAQVENGAQVVNGGIYRIVNYRIINQESWKYEYFSPSVIIERPRTHKLYSVTKVENGLYQEYWKFEQQSDGGYAIKNIFTGRYIQHRTSGIFETGENVASFVVKSKVIDGNTYYNITDGNGANALCCEAISEEIKANSSLGPDDKNYPTGTEWMFEKIELTEEEIAAAAAEYQAFLDADAKFDEIEAAAKEFFTKYFKDPACTELKDDVDETVLAEALKALPADLQAAVLKIKNNTWAEREKEFRIYDYTPYSNPEVWADRLFLRPFNRINNPTGICSNTNAEYLYVFLEKIPEGSTVTLSQIPYTRFSSGDGTEVELKEGFNLIKANYKNANFYVRYVVDTKVGEKKLADYPAVKVHIEGGYVNGFWSKERGHTNEDWAYMKQNMFKNPESVIALGDWTMLNFRTREFLQEGCPEKIVEVMELWDFWNTSQRKNMGLDKYEKYFNNKQLAMSNDQGFMDASSYRTHYNNYTIKEITNYDILVNDAGQSWGPNHEIGHTNQYAFELVGTSEVSNNALANFAIFEVGTHTSRGNNMENQILDFEANVPYVVRGEKEYGQKLFSMTRMYFQLYLYFHAAGNEPEFYPTLFEELRKDRLVGHTTRAQDQLNEYGYYVGSMDAKHDQLKFIEKCCEITKTDLTEFFEAWGFFIPMKNAFVGDYGHHYVYLTQGAIDSCKTAIKAKNYPNKGGHLMFIEDRVRPSKRLNSSVNKLNDGKDTRLDYSNEVPVGTVGDFGQWEDYLDKSVKAEGYYYTISNGRVQIVEAEGAKGALGFKLYDAKSGKLLTYTNRKEMVIPVQAIGAELKVVAAQASGEDAVLALASAAKDEALKLTALKTALDRADIILGCKREEGNGNEIGYYYQSSLTNMETIYAAAKKAYDEKNPGTSSYEELCTKLNAAIAEVTSNIANRVTLEEEMYVTMQSALNKTTLLTNGGVKLDAGNTNGASTSNSKAWTIEYAGKLGEYYLKDADGYYVGDVALHTMVNADMTSPVSAAKFNVIYNDDATITFSLVNNPGIALGVYEEYSWGQLQGRYIRGMNSNTEASCWNARIKKSADNSKEHYQKELEAAIAKANLIITEVLNVNNLNTDNFLKNNIEVLDQSLKVSAPELYKAYSVIVGDKDNAAKHKEYLNTLRDLLSRIEGTYVVKSPIFVAGSTVAWYRMACQETGDYLSVKDITTENNILTTVYPNAVDDNCLWCFVVESNGNVKVYNAGRSAFMYRNPKSSRYVFVSKENSTPIKIEFDEEDKNGVILNIEDKTIKESDGEIKYGGSKNATTWVLELVSIEENQALVDAITSVDEVIYQVVENNEIYDLSGRRVVTPTKGIYIQNGKKVVK